MADIKTDIYQEDSDKIARGKRLTLVRHIANMSRHEMEKYDLSAETLKNWELGRFSGLTDKGARRIVTIFKEIGVEFSMGWLLHGKGTPPVILNESITQEPLLGHEGEEILLPEEIRVFCKRSTDIIYMKVDDDGMEPYYREGDYVAGKRYYNESIPAAIGKDCIVETQMGEILLRRVREGKKEGYYSLLCLNADTVYPAQFLYEVELISAAPVSLCLRSTE
jgi:hypothetical protein